VGMTRKPIPWPSLREVSRLMCEMTSGHAAKRKE
jgi:hypothetical protein